MWGVSTVRIESASEPLVGDAELVQAAATLVARGAVMGFLPLGTSTLVLDTNLLSSLLVGLADQGVSVRQLLARNAWTHASVREAVSAALEQSEHSPMPLGEWPSLVSTLGEELLAQLLGVSVTSVHRYAAGSRPTPQLIAGRLHVLALIVADLAGGYNEFGIRRWFTRARPQLDGASPLELLQHGWDPEGAEALQLRGLAAGLVGAGAT